MTSHYSKLRGKNKCNWLVPPNHIGMMCGVKYARQTKSGDITLTYEDGTEETRNAVADLCTEFESFFAIVSFVQAAREKAA